MDNKPQNCINCSAPLDWQKECCVHCGTFYNQNNDQTYFYDTHAIPGVDNRTTTGARIQQAILGRPNQLIPVNISRNQDIREIFCITNKL